MALRELKKAMQRDAIVRNALDLFREKGYDNVTCDEIARASLCARSTFHRYFRTKEDLLFPTIPDRQDVLRAQLRAANADEGPRDVLRRAFGESPRGLLSDIEPDLRSECVRLWFTEAAPWRHYLEICAEYEMIIAEFFRSVVDDDPDAGFECQLGAAAVMGVLRATLNIAMENGEDIDNLIDRGFAFISMPSKLDKRRSATTRSRSDHRRARRA